VESSSKLKEGWHIWSLKPGGDGLQVAPEFQRDPAAMSLLYVRASSGRLIPIELEPYLAGSSEMQIELDPQTAKIPWELLETPSESEEHAPWAIRVKLLRKLRLKEFRERVRQSACMRFTTVLGPGSDDFHKTHIHLDLIERRDNYRICQWDVLTAPEVGSALSPEHPRVNLLRRL